MIVSPCFVAQAALAKLELCPLGYWFCGDHDAFRRQRHRQVNPKPTICASRRHTERCICAALARGKCPAATSGAGLGRPVLVSETRTAWRFLRHRYNLR
jgi:hypothetical protein